LFSSSLRQLLNHPPLKLGQEHYTRPIFKKPALYTRCVDTLYTENTRSDANDPLSCRD